MAAPAHDKYYLRTLHQEIDLFDRKLAHMLKYDTFATEGERTISVTKMRAKRELLVTTARQLIGQGIEFKPSEMPRSLRSSEEDGLKAAESSAVLAPIETLVALPLASAVKRQLASPFAGSVLDGQTMMQNYKRTRAKAAVSQA